MLSSNRVSLFFIVLLLSALACVAPAASTPDSNALGTMVAETVIAAITQSLQPQLHTQTPLPNTLTPTLTFTPETPTPTPTQTSTPTPTFTSTPEVPLVSVSVATNCRNGPGKVYDYEGALLVGEIAEVLARDPTGNYWYIRNPDSAGNFCWLWWKYATLIGNAAILRVYTPPPTPTPTFTPNPTFTFTPSPDFDASYASLDTCTGWWVEVKLKNTGSIPFKSVGITVKDTITNVTLSNLTDGFIDINGCLTSISKDTLEPDKTYVISAPAFTYNPTGHLIQAAITLCSNTGQSGTCITKKTEFTP